MMHEAETLPRNLGALVIDMRSIQERCLWMEHAGMALGAAGCSCQLSELGCEGILAAPRCVTGRAGVGISAAVLLGVRGEKKG